MELDQTFTLLNIWTRLLFFLVENLDTAATIISKSTC